MMRSFKKGFVQIVRIMTAAILNVSLYALQVSWDGNQAQKTPHGGFLTCLVLTAA